MYPLPDDFDPTIFVGRTLSRLTFTSNTLEFVFDPEILIRVLGEVRHDGADGQGRWYDGATLPIRASRLMRLLDATVEEVAIEDRATLALSFDNEHVLRLVEDTTMYESYHLHIGDRHIIV
jgi:hypothetical protein